jgi:hypothetical protein
MAQEAGEGVDWAARLQRALSATPGAPPPIRAEAEPAAATGLLAGLSLSPVAPAREPPPPMPTSVAAEPSHALPERLALLEALAKPSGGGEAVPPASAPPAGRAPAAETKLPASPGTGLLAALTAPAADAAPMAAAPLPAAPAPPPKPAAQPAVAPTPAAPPRAGGASLSEQDGLAMLRRLRPQHQDELPRIQALEWAAIGASIDEAVGRWSALALGGRGAEALAASLRVARSAGLSPFLRVVEPDPTVCARLQPPIAAAGRAAAELRQAPVRGVADEGSAGGALVPALLEEGPRFDILRVMLPNLLVPMLNNHAALLAEKTSLLVLTTRSRAEEAAALQLLLAKGWRLMADHPMTIDVAAAPRPSAIGLQIWRSPIAAGP